MGQCLRTLLIFCILMGVEALVAPSTALSNPREPLKTPRLSPIALIVEEVSFVADIPASLSRELCNASSSPAAGVGGRGSCGSETRCFLAPNPIRNYPEVLTLLRVGEQHYPGVSRESLTAMLISSLSEQGDFVLRRTVEGELSHLSRSETPPYILRGRLTELGLDTEKTGHGFHGMGFGPLAATRLLSTKSELRRSYVRFDFRLIDPKTQRIVAAFPVAATFSQSQSKLTISSFRESDKIIQGLINQAARQALEGVAEKIKEAHHLRGGR